MNSNATAGKAWFDAWFDLTVRDTNGSYIVTHTNIPSVADSTKTYDLFVLTDASVAYTDVKSTDVTAETSRAEIAAYLARFAKAFVK